MQTKTITLNDTDKLNQEYAAWLGAGISPELLTLPVGLTVRNVPVLTVDEGMRVFHDRRERALWRNCDAFIRFKGIAWNVDESGTSETDGYDCRVTRPLVSGDLLAASCPECGDDAGFFGRGDVNGKTYLFCHSCQERVGAVERGVPAEYAEVK